MSYISHSIKSIDIVLSTALLPLVDVIIFGNGVTSMSGTIQTSKMDIGQTILIKRNVGSTGVLTIKGESGKIQNLNNTLATTTLTNGKSSTGKNVLFIWNGIDLLRLSNG